MKLRSLLFLAVLLAGTNVPSFAVNPPVDVKGTLNDFAESHMNTDAGKMQKIISPNAVMKFTLGTQVQTYSQQSILSLMKQNLGVKQNCSTQIDLVASSDALVLARVSFVYEGYVIENYLTVEWNGKNWHITRIDKFFNDEKSSKVLTRE